MGAIRRSIPITSPFPDCRALLRRSNSNRKYARQASRSVAPRNLVYYQHSGSGSGRPSLHAFGETQPRGSETDGGPCENASLDDFAAHRGPLHRAACRVRGGFIRRAGACRASRDDRALSGHFPTCADEASLRRRAMLLALRSQPERAGFSLFRVRIWRHRLCAAPRGEPRILRHSGAGQKNRPCTFARRAARAAPFLLIATVFP